MRFFKTKILTLFIFLFFITGCNQVGVASPNVDGNISDEVIGKFTDGQKVETEKEVASEEVEASGNQDNLQVDPDILNKETRNDKLYNQDKEDQSNGENPGTQIVRDSEEVILVAMEEKYKLYQKAWRVNEREEGETPLEYFQKYAQEAVSERLLQEGIDFFTGPPMGFSSSKTETLIAAKVRSRVIDQAVITSTWEHITIGDGPFTKDLYNIIIKMKKKEQEWMITDLVYELISQEELTEEDLI